MTEGSSRELHDTKSYSTLLATSLNSPSLLLPTSNNFLALLQPVSKIANLDLKRF